METKNNILLFMVVKSRVTFSDYNWDDNSIALHSFK